MRNHSRFVYFFIPLLCVYFGIDISNSAEIKSYPAAEIPIFYEAYNVNKTLDDSSETVTVNYHVQGVHPAAEVLEFYDTYFNARGWISSFEICQRNWADLGDTPKTDVPFAKLLFASWQHARSNRKVLLWIRQQTHPDEQQDEVVVEYQLRPIREK